jgi:hypothetical protein
MKEGVLMAQLPIDKMGDKGEKNGMPTVVVNRPPQVTQTASVQRTATEPPAGFISFDEFIEKNPKFCEKYEQLEHWEAHMAIWLDEPVDGMVCVSQKDEEGNSAATIIPIPHHTTYTLKVIDFINWFGDPNLKLHLPKPPANLGYKDEYWKRMRNEKLRIWCRELTMKPVTTQNGMHKSFFTPVVNNKLSEYGTYDLFGKYPKVWILLPTQMIMATTAAKDIVDFVWEAMQTRNVNCNSKKFTEDEIKGVGDEMYAKAKEYKMEGVFGMTTAGTVVESFMLAAKEKYQPK